MMGLYPIIRRKRRPLLAEAADDRLETAGGRLEVGASLNVQHRTSNIELPTPNGERGTAAVPMVAPPMAQGADAGAAGMGEGPAAVGVPIGVEAGEPGATVPAVGATVAPKKRSHHKKKVVVEPAQPGSVTAV